MIQFSQYYTSPAILGPSFAGLGGDTKVALNYRNQWPGVPGNYVTYAFSFSHYFINRYSGAGLYVIRDQAGSGNLGLTSVGVQYTYEIPLVRQGRNFTSGLRPGISFSYSQRGVDFYKLIFSDQLSFEEIATSSIEDVPSNVGYLDASASILYFSKNIWAGITIDHLLEPNQSMTGGESKIRRMILAYGGFQFRLKDRKRRRYRKGESVTIGYLFKMTDSFKQLDLGGYWLKNNFMMGLWYRGLPVLNNSNEGYYNSDAMILMLGYTLDKLQLGYSYDVTVSQLMQNTAGSHEISASYNFKIKVKRKRGRRRGAIECPSF